MTTNGAPADDTYAALCKRHAGLEREAGAFLARSLRPDTENPVTARRIAEDFAREANEVSDQMEAWRLANGWDK